MNLIAAVITGKGSGAIAAIQLFGCQASEILEEIFIPSKKSQAAFTIGNIILGTINTNSNVIDQVLLGCEGKDIFTINCHGNPLIVSDILEILKEKGVKIVSAEYLLAQIYSKKTEINSIALEAKLAIAKAATLDGTRIIAHQIKNGLLETIKKWHKENIAHEKIREEAKKILQDSKKAKFLIYGCKIVLAGPPNSGKSTLFNCLTGKEKTIVTDIKGTTRDWVSANCQIGKLSAELFDTAGLDENISAEQIVEKQAQQKSYEILEQADLVLLVLDAGNRTPLITKQFLKRIKDKADRKSVV
jgi:tRNA modification GTPase